MATENRIFKTGALPRDVLQIGIRLAGTTDDLRLIARPNNFQFNPVEVSDELRSGGRVQDTESVVTSYDWQFEVGGEPLGVLAILLGATVTTTGTRPNMVQTFEVKNDVDLPYFEIHVVSLSDGGGTMLTVLERAKLGSLGMDRDYGTFARIPATGTCVAADTSADGSIGFVRTYTGNYRLTGIAEQGTEFGNRPFGSRYMAVADTWFDTHVWDYFQWESPDMVEGSQAAVTYGTNFAIDLEHYAIQESTFSASEMAMISGNEIAAAEISFESEVDEVTPMTAEIVALMTQGVMVPTTGIENGTLRITRADISGVGDYDNEDTISVFPDTSGDWVYYPTGANAGSLINDDLSAPTQVYYKYNRDGVRVVFTAASGVAAGDTVYFQYNPAQELVTRQVEELTDAVAYVGDSTTDNVTANQFDTTSVIQQRGLEARWLAEGEADYSGRVWIDNSAIGTATIADGEAFSLQGTGFARRASQMLLAQGGTSAIEITTYPITANDRIARFAAQVNKATVEAMTYGMDFALRLIVEREKATTTTVAGADQTDMRLLTARSRDYFTLIRQSASANEGGARDTFHRCKIRESDQTLEESQFLMIPMTIDAIGDDQEGDKNAVVVTKQHFETYTAIDLHRI